MTLDQEVQLGLNIKDGELSHAEAVFIAMCVRFAIDNGVAAKIGTFGVDMLDRAARPRSPVRGD